MLPDRGFPFQGLGFRVQVLGFRRALFPGFYRTPTRNFEGFLFKASYKGSIRAFGFLELKGSGTQIVIIDFGLKRRAFLGTLRPNDTLFGHMDPKPQTLNPKLKP